MNKKDKIRIAFTAVFTVMCITPCAAMLFYKGEDNIGNEQIPDKPELISGGKVNEDFSDDFEQYFSYILPLRNKSITVGSRIKSKVFGTGSEKVIVGKDGWLFYNEEVERQCGAKRMSEREICAAAEYLFLLNEYCKNNDINFIFAAAPDKANVCSEKLPLFSTMQEISDLDRLHSKLDELDVPYCDIAAVFGENGCSYYLRTDTHWNNLGAIIAWNAVMNSIGSPHKSYDGAEFSLSEDITGDLARMLYPDSTPAEKDYAIQIDMNDDYRFVRPSSIAGISDKDEILRTLMGNSERYDQIIQTKNPSAAGGNAVIRRDSFCRAMLPYFIDNYKSAYFTRGMTVSSDELSDADDFIYEIVERNLSLIVGDACYIPAPIREIPACVGQYHGNDSMDIEIYSQMLALTGELDAARFADRPDAAIILIFSSEDICYAFEAFPVGKNGYKAYLDTSAVKKGSYDIYAAVNGVYTEALGSADIQ